MFFMLTPLLLEYQHLHVSLTAVQWCVLVHVFLVCLYLTLDTYATGSDSYAYATQPQHQLSVLAIQ